MRLVAFLLGVLCAVPAWALDREELWVRAVADCAAQSGGTCGSENGSSFANAYRGSADIAVSGSDGTANTLDPGDKLTWCIRVGSYFGDADKKNSTAMFTPNGTNISGDATTPTWLTGDCSAQSGYSAMAWLNGEDLVFRGIDSSSASHAYWRIDSFEISRVTGTGIYSQGVYTDNQPWTIDNVYVHDITAVSGRGIRIQGIGTTLTNSRVDNTGDDNIYWEGASAKIIGNQLSRPSVAGVTGDNIQFDKSAANTLIAGNRMSTAVDAKQCVFISTTTAGDGTGVIQDNDCLGPSSSATLHTAFFVENANGGRWTFRRNYAEKSRYLIFCGGDSSDVKCTAIGNIGRDLGTGIQGGTGTSDHIFQDNSIYDAAVCISTQAATGTSVIQNNAMSGCSTSAIRKNSGDTESYNAVNGSGDFVQNETVTTTAGTGAVTATFGWVDAAPTGPDGFCLSTSSALLAAGTTLGPYATGYGNQDLGKPPAIGARRFCDSRRAVTSRRAISNSRAP